MKKIYTAPQTQVVKIKAENLICSSPEGYNSNMADIQSAKSGSAALDKDYDEDFIDELW